MRRRTLIATSLMGILMSESSDAQSNLDPANTLYMDLKDGRVVIELRVDLAPKHVERVKALVAKKFYDNTPFHRVIEGFMAQGGDPTGTGMGGSDMPNLQQVGAARSGDPNSANSQFYIMFAPAPHLDGQYTIWGRVVQGMEFIDKIKRGAGGSGTVQNPDRIIRVRLASDPQ